jgi:hypothetical protein
MARQGRLCRNSCLPLQPVVQPAMIEHPYEYAVQEATWNAMRGHLDARTRQRGVVPRRRCQPGRLTVTF